VFVANTDAYRSVPNFNLPQIPALDGRTTLAFEFSTKGHVLEVDRMLSDKGFGSKVSVIGPGEGRVYRVLEPQPGLS
jgi:hypothetical protein